MSGIGKRIKERRSALGLSQPQLAQKIGGITYQAIQAIERGGNTKHMFAIAKALGVTPEWLQDGTGHPPGPSSLPPSAGQQGTADKLKVLGMAECGPDGVALWNGEVVDMVNRPPNLAGVSNAFAVYVQGVSMENRYHPGEIVYIHPGKPITPGTYVLVQLHPKDDGGPPRAFLKRLVRRSGAKVVLEQFNPPKTFNLALDEIISMYRVVGSGDG